MQSFDCRKNTTLNAGALPNGLSAQKEAKQLMVAEALKSANGNQSVAAMLLGMTRQALNNRIAHSQKSSDDA